MDFMRVLKNDEFGHSLVSPTELFRNGLSELFDDQDDETRHKDEEHNVLSRRRAAFIFVKVLNVFKK